MIGITVRYLGNSYHGMEYPPSPMRLFSALVAGGHTGAWSVRWPEFESSVRWLEQQPPPTIRCIPAVRQSPLRRYVPNNNMDKWADSLETGREIDPRKLTTGKVELRWLGRSPLIVNYEWAATPPATDLEALKLLASTVTHVGLGIDIAMVIVDSWDDPAAVVWAPGPPNGPAQRQYLRVPVTSSFDALEANWQRRRALATSSAFNLMQERTAWMEVPYARRAPAHQAGARTMVFRIDQSDETLAAWPITWQLEVAAWVRHAVGTLTEKSGVNDATIRESVMGHGANDSVARLAFLPLPTIGRYADGAIRRFMVAEVNTEGSQVLDDVWSAVEDLPGVPLTDTDGLDVAVVGQPVLSTDKVTQLYTQSSTMWATVSPVIMPQYEDVEAGIARALQQSGIDPALLEDFECSRSPMVLGATRAERYHVAAYMRRPRYHFRLRFKEPVSGPIALGVGRYYGIGLCVAVS